MTNSSHSYSNVPEFSVGDLANSLKRTIEDQYGRVRVRGELSRVSIAGSGHMYSSLKDENAVIDAVCWKGVMSKLEIKPEEGLEVIVTGRVTTYPQRSNYQLVIETMELAGEGALLKMLEERKKSLMAEGLFAPERKKKLPFLPKTIGVVTSPTGAVIRDILHRLNDRFPRHVLVWPVLVQGQGAAEQVAQAIEGFQSINEHGIARPDLLIVARGGGSLEDLMPFNEEVVVRAVANSAIPVISAVGHETDTTLCDFAADERAPTPTGAAERAVPVRADLQAQILDLDYRLKTTALRMVEQRCERVNSFAARLGDPSRILEGYIQRVDHLGERISGVFTHYLAAKKERLMHGAASLRPPELQIKEANYSLQRASEKLENLKEKLLSDKQVNVSHSAKMLEAYSFKNVLARGYSVVRDENGAVIQNPATLQAGEIISIEFKDDVVHQASIGSGHKPVKTKKAPQTRTAKPSADQQSLF